MITIVWYSNNGNHGGWEKQWVRLNNVSPTMIFSKPQIIQQTDCHDESPAAQDYGVQC